MISLDGAAAAWNRMPTTLVSGSVLLLQHRSNQFVYAGLKPWVHYVPLRDDISDLVEPYEWLLDQPSQAKTLADNGRRFACEVLNSQALETFFARVVDWCGALYTT